MNWASDAGVWSEAEEEECKDEPGDKWDDDDDEDGNFELEVEEDEPGLISPWTEWST